MTTRTGIVEAFSTKAATPRCPYDDSQYSIKIKPDSGGATVSFSGKPIGQTYKNGDKVTYYETADPYGKMLYTL